MHACKRILLASALTLIELNPVRAQHASDNPVSSAEDAFGLTLGLESIGMYSPGQVRGFSPQAAGNVRIDGLYFDQQGTLSNRVIEGSTVRVGVSEIGYAFPAPTGIVDYSLRRAGDGTPNATVIANAGPYDARGLSIDCSLPLIGTELLLPVGISSQVSTQTPYGSFPGYTSTITNAGATPRWSPNENLTVRALIDWQQTHGAKTFPLYFTAGDYVPPAIQNTYHGQNWAQGKSLTENLGAFVEARFSREWSLTAGVFHSVANYPVSYADLYTDIQQNGRSEHVVVGYPNQTAASTSGEARLKGRFKIGDWHHQVVILARGRDVLARYGGEDSVDVGSISAGTSLQVPEPAFTYSARTHDRSELWSIGSAYQVDWRGVAELEFGLQKENYAKSVISPGLGATEMTDHPWRSYGNAGLAISSRATLYVGYTQGLEDSGAAPSSAANPGAVLPASLTWQVESGVRYQLTPRFKVIAGVYELHKPYFNFDTSNVDRELGAQKAKGVELSISGQQIAHFDVNVGILDSRVNIVGPDLIAEGVGPVAVGQPRLQYVANVNYTVPWWRAATLDLAATHFGSQPGSVNNETYTAATTLLNLGGRYKFTVLGMNSSLRIQIQNAPNSHTWTNVYTPGFFQWPAPRTIFAYFTTDL